jgi:elongation factor G
MNEANAESRPVVSMTVSPRGDGDESLQRALSVLIQQDPALRITASPGQTVIGGESESHLESIRKHLLDESKIQADIGRPQIIYLETIRKQAAAEGECIYRSGNNPHMYGKVMLRLEPLSSGSGYQFVNGITNGAVPEEFVEPINSAVQDAMKAGILAGQEIVDLRAVLCDGNHHLEDSSESAFRIAATIAFKDAVRKANPVILEPIVSVEIRGQEKYLNIGVLIGDLRSRRGRIVGLEHYDNSLLLRAIVPMAEMLGYASYIRARGQGHAECSVQLIHYAEALPDSGAGDDEAGDFAIKPKGTKPESGGDEAGVLAIKPQGPKPKSRSAAVELDTE